MATYIRSQTTIPRSSGLSADNVVWTFHWLGTSTTPDRDADALIIRSRLTGYLNHYQSPGVAGAMGASSSMNLPASFTEFFDLTEPRPRVPFEMLLHSVVPAASTAGVDFPSEVALVVSYQGPKASGINHQRRRGRHYFGPLQSFAAAGTDMTRPPTAALTALRDNFEADLCPGTTGEPFLCVYSRSTHAGYAVGQEPPEGESPPEVATLIDEAFVIADTAYVDDEWDTQRRRGFKPTTRSTITLPTPE